MLWAALLAGIAGYVDAICYLRLGGAFAANMTGNLVEVGMGIAARQWSWAAWCASLIIAFLLGILAARLLLRTHRSPRLSLLIEAGVIAAAASGKLGLAAVPVLAAAMAMQNEAVTHGVVAVNVAFITGDIQRLGERIVPGTMPGQQPRKHEGQRWLILAILVFYAAGAAIGTVASGWDAPALILPAAVLAGGALLPKRWTGSAAQRQ
ncbi:MAG: DUF1275 domain-containing protein [Alphaproteobacteria bacterium]|nr:DUF1275 domain-containing protein [Alphaproteobacteria bacterium]MBV9583471.1 DUF1275 domain-containing protein [Alphaproteobacteria bacterium]